MWVQMKKTYIGPAGTFLKDGPYDLPKATIKRLPKGSYKKTCAPWDRLKKKVTKKKKVSKKKVSKKKEPAVEPKPTKPKTPKPTGKQITTPNDKQLRPGKPGDYETK
jgi:hypothetical protein